MENYEFVCQIGKGNFGRISKIIRKSDRKTLIWKELDYGQMSEKEKEQIVSEVNILRELKHPNIVRYYDRIIDKKHSRIYIIMEYCEGGDLNQLIKRCKKTGEFIAEDKRLPSLMPIVPPVLSIRSACKSIICFSVSIISA